MTRLNGSLIYVVAIVVIALGTGLAVVRLSAEQGTDLTIGAVIAFGTLLAKSFFDSMKTAQLAAEVRDSARTTAAVATGISARVEHVVAKVEKVGMAVDGINTAALLNQSRVSDQGGFERGVKEMGEAVEATAPTGATPLIMPTYDPRDAAPPTKQNMIWVGHPDDREEPRVFH
jgi:hypothetical protein